MKMSNDYLADLHRFLNTKEENEFDAYKQKALYHLKFMPYKKLYRYRKCNENELSTIQSNSIWLSDPQDFPDMFDSIIPIDKQSQYLSYSYLLIRKIGYLSLVETLDKSDTTITEKEWYDAIEDVLDKYTPKELNLRCLEIASENELAELEILSGTVNETLTIKIEMLDEFFDIISLSPRESLSIASFTTDCDNRKMWEIYANNYTGFCVEYKFSMNQEDLQYYNDILHLLPMSYYANRPKFEFEQILENIVEADLNIADLTCHGKSFLQQYYQSILSKNADYRVEKEWRFIGSKDYRGKYKFPYISKVILGKDISGSDESMLRAIAKDLNVLVQKQKISIYDDNLVYV